MPAGFTVTVMREQRDTLPDFEINEVSKELVYPKGRFHFKNKYSVETTVGSISPNKKQLPIPLLRDPHAMAMHKKKYRHVHVGLVQVYVEPAELSKISGSISLYLKDKRLLDFSDSFLNVPQSSEINDPLNFYPNFIVSLEEIDVLHHLTLLVRLNFRTENLKSKFYRSVLSLTYKVHYKWLGKHVNPAAKCYGPGIETVFGQWNMRSPADLTPRIVKRSDIKLPKGWTAQDEISEEQEHNSLKFFSLTCSKIKLEFPRQ